MDEYHKQMKIAAEARKDAKEHGAVFDKKGNSNLDGHGAGNAGNNNKSNNGDYLQQVINNQNNPVNMTREQKIQQLEKGIADETANYKSARLATIMGPANLAAGIGLGLGMGEEVSESLFKGGYITAGLDKMTEAVGRKSADKDRRTFAQYEQGQGEKYGYTPSEKIIREKTVIEKTIEKSVMKNEDGKIDLKHSISINPIAVGREIGKQFTGIGDVLSDTMKKELKTIDRSLDDSQ